VPIEFFTSGGIALKEEELSLIGDIKGKRVLQLTCSVGDEVISFAKLGAMLLEWTLLPPISRRQKSKVNKSELMQIFKTQWKVFRVCILGRFSFRNRKNQRGLLKVVANKKYRFLSLIFIVGGILLQIFLSRQESKWAGLILPIITFILSLIYVLNIAVTENLIKSI